MKEGKQQQKFQIKVKLLSGETKVFATHNHFHGGGKYTHSELSDIMSNAADYVEAASKNGDPLIKLDQTEHAPDFQQHVIVPTSLLKGQALDWAVAQFLNWKEPFHDKGEIQYVPEDNYIQYFYPDPDEMDELVFDHSTSWQPSISMTIAGQLMQKFNVAVRPKTREVQNPTIEATYAKGDYNAGDTVEAPTYPMAICIALLVTTNGSTTMIPAALEQSLV